MNSNYNYIPSSYSNPGYSENSSNDRLIGGGFFGPFLLGGITGGLLAPSFNGGGYGRPNYYTNNYYPPYPPYYYPPYPGYYY